jgi:hypothetical protein
VTLSGVDGLYTVTVIVTDSAANTTTVSSSITLDTTGPAVSASISPPNNGMYYDVGARITVTWTSTDPNGTGTSSASIESQTISSSGGTIDVDSLLAGSHTLTVTGFDAAGNSRSVTITVTIRATAAGILNAINDGATRGFMTAAEKATLVSSINNVIGAGGNSGSAKMRQFISQLQSATTAQLSADYKTLLLNWANDALSRM